MTLRLILRNLVAYRLRLALTVAAVVLGVAFVSGTLIFRDSTQRGFDQLFTKAYTDVEIVVKGRQTVTGDDLPAPPIPAAVLDTLRQQVPGARSVYGTAEGYAAVADANGTVVGPPGMAQLGGEWADGAGSPMRIVSGSAPRTRGEVAIDAATAELGGIEVGEEVLILTQRATETMRVTAVFRFTEASNLNGLMTYAALPMDVAQELLVAPGHYSEILVHARDGVSRDQLADQIRAVLPPGLEVTTGQKEVDQARRDVGQLLDFLAVFLLVFAGVSVFVGSFIIFNTFSMVVAQRSRELALLRALGANRGQVTRSVLGEALGIGLVGSTLGLAAGAGLALGLDGLFGLFGIHLPMDGPAIGPATILWSYAVGVTVTVLSAYPPVRRSARVPPVAAMREDAAMPARSMTLRAVAGAIVSVLGGVVLAGGLALGGGDGAFLVAVGAALGFVGVIVLGPVLSRPAIRALGWPAARWAGAVGRMSRDNARRNPRRSAATASALMVGLALVSMFSVLAQSMNRSVDRAFDRDFGADFALQSRSFTGFSPEAVRSVAAAPGVREVTPVRFGVVRVGAEELPVLVAEPSKLIEPVRLRVDAGTAGIGRDELLVQRSTATTRGWTVGSTVRVEYPDGVTVPVRVAGIFADNRLMSRPYVLTPASYGAHAPGELVQLAYVDTENGTQARRAVESALAAYPNVSLQDRQQAKARAQSDVNQLLTIAIALLVLSIVIAALGIVNTLALSVVERTREIGLLRAVGMSRGQLRRMVRYEAVVIAAFGAVLGVGAGVLIGWALQRSLASQGIDVLSIPYGLLASYLAAAGVVGVVAAIWPARRAARMDVLTAIASP